MTKSTFSGFTEAESEFMDLLDSIEHEMGLAWDWTDYEYGAYGQLAFDEARKHRSLTAESLRKIADMYAVEIHEVV